MCNQGSVWVDGKNGYNTESETDSTSMFTSVKQMQVGEIFVEQKNIKIETQIGKNEYKGKRKIKEKA